MSIQVRVESRIKRLQKGQPFAIQSFYALGTNAAVQKAFSRLVAQGELARVGRGIYCRPKPLQAMPSVKTTTTAEKLARYWVRLHGYKMVPQGVEEAYRLGLQTQAPMRTIYWTNGPSKVFTIGNQKVEVRHVANELIRGGMSAPARLRRGLAVMKSYKLESTSLAVAQSRLNMSRESFQRALGEYQPHRHALSSR
ncbi:DUF6088 family protein [Ferrimonas sp. YFM]|uniref:DUF6088 family protein n=1 Tax=Ferrimonas sp. YFM TaxID=3028878 RepID=UPI002573F0F4|nr:DUF6088 family protein [Ferrimonas sp. YFM]BDY04685.1 hypothetical protein F0521_17260 [Ferrimonas sp. YFM]